MVRTIGITGIETKLGIRLAGRARAAGLRVRGLDLKGKGAHEARRLHVDVRSGGLTDREALRAFVQGLDVVVHSSQAAAGVTGWRALRRHHVDGTDCLASEARSAGVSRLVHLSSVPVAGDLPEGSVNEVGLYRWAGDPFQQTSLEAERLVMRYHRSSSLQVCVLRSADVYGPGALGWVLKPLRLIQRGLLMLPREHAQWMNPVFVDNLCDAVFQGMRTQHTGQAFNITDDTTVPVTRYFRSLATLARCRAPVQLPGRMHRVLTHALRRGSRALGRQEPQLLLPERIHGARGGYSTRNARALLGHQPKVALHDGFRRTERWLHAQGIIRR